MFDKFCNIFALGQCGNRIGYQLNALGFNVYYSNFDEVDLRGMEIPKDNLLLMDKRGTGGSYQKGKKMVDDNFEEFKDFLLGRLSKEKINLFVVGLGGGSGGSMITNAVEIANEANYKTVVLATLPPKLQGFLATDNAMRSLKHLKQTNVCSLILADNEHLMKTVGLGTNWWEEINKKIISRLVHLFGLLKENKKSYSGIGSIDQAEIMRILQHGKGMTDIRDISFEFDTLSMEEDELRSRLFEPSLISGYNYRGTLAYLVSVDVPQVGSFTDFSSRVFDVTKKVCGSSVSRLGMFTDPDLKKSIRVILINAGLQLPNVLKSKINNLKRDSERLDAKMSKEEKIDFADLDSISVDEEFQY